MTTNVTLAEEAEALLLEGKTPLPTELESLKAEYDQLNREIAEKEARKEEIKVLTALTLDAHNASMFTVNGVNAFGYNQTTRTTVDSKKLWSDFPEVAKVVVSSKPSRSFFSKK
jgi:predicted phage-related endonuclease